MSSCLRFLGLIVVCVMILPGCNPKTTGKTGQPAAETIAPKPTDKVSPKASDTKPWFQFEDMTRLWGIKFHQTSGNSAEKHFPAANGSGVAIFDADNNGWMDLYFVTARHLPFEPGSEGPRNGLFLNFGPGGFTEVAQAAGLDFSLFCHGVVHGDLDNDGFADLVLTTYGGTHLLMNNGDGTFNELEGFADPRWGSSVAVADTDNDGNLDIYVTHYGIWSVETNQHCGDQEKQLRTFCNPRRIPPTKHALFHNGGDRSFADVTDEAGLFHEDGRGQGVVAADIDLDGDIDFYVANDLCPNFVYLNEGNGKFFDQTDFSGASLSREGMSQAGMGCDCADINRDGLPDLYVTNFGREYNALYLNLDKGGFLDQSHMAGVAGDSMEEVGWGTRMVDFDNDGWLDIFVSNGHVDDNIAELNPGSSYAQLPKLWKNFKGTMRFQTASAGSYFSDKHVGRGVAFGDLDNDGRLDLAINHIDSAAAVLRNVTTPADGPAHWIRFGVQGRLSARDAVGTTVTLIHPDLPGPIVEQRTSGASYLSGHDPRIPMGLGKFEDVGEVSVRWPSGRTSKLTGLQVDRDILVVEPLTTQ